MNSDSEWMPRYRAARLFAIAPDTTPLTIDVDGNGRYDALTDGILLQRYLFGLRETSLLPNAVAPNATRKTAAHIETYVQGLLP